MHKIVYLSGVLTPPPRFARHLPYRGGLGELRSRKASPLGEGNRRKAVEGYFHPAGGGGVKLNKKHRPPTDTAKSACRGLFFKNG